MKLAPRRIPKTSPQVEMAGGTMAAVPLISCYDIEQLQFLNGLMIDITEDDIVQAVETSYSDQLADAQTSTIATSKDATSALYAPETPTPSAPAQWNIDIDDIFDSRPAPRQSPTTKRSRAVSTHRLFTSQELIDEKKAKLVKK